MRVLIVDGYPSNPAGKVAFKTFYGLVMSSFNETKTLDVDGINVSVRHHTKLDPYLYDHETHFIDPMAVMEWMGHRCWRGRVRACRTNNTTADDGPWGGCR